MNDKEIENIHTVDVSVTAETMDDHVHVLRQNGYLVRPKFTNYSYLALSFVLGAYIIGTILQ